MFEGGNLQFESEDELRKPIPPGTVAQVQVRKEKDRDFGDFRNGESQYGPWMIIPLEVIDGDHKGEWASMMLNIKTDDRRFRKTFEIVTGADISGGGSISFDQFVEGLKTGVFEGELGPEKRKNKETGVMEETGYSKCFQFNKKVGDRDSTPEAAAVTDTDVPAIGAEGADDDIPF